MTTQTYPIGTPGVAWGDTEKSLWLQQQQIKRSYHAEVVAPLFKMLELPEIAEQAELIQYGNLAYTPLGLADYPLFAVKSKQWQPALPWVLVTGGVHGYETSGVQGALQFIAEQFVAYSQCVNLLILPCISPWGYETINRWDPLAIDPNRSFVANSPAQESAAALALLATFQTPLLHVDLHETTDSDNSEFGPAKAARDGKDNRSWEIPDGFYLVGDTEKPQLEFQQAIIQAVAQVTHIAKADLEGCLIGEKMVSPGVILYAKKALGLCGGMTDAPFVTTTEVYPDSPTATAEQCNQAQVTTICSAIDFVLQQHQAN